MSISIEKLKAAAAAKAAEEKTEDEEKKKDTPSQPANPENPAPAPAEPANPENPDGKPGEDDDEDEAKKALSAVQSLSAKLDAAEKRIVALENGLKAAQAENGRLKGALRDPAFAAAALRAEEVPAGGDASATTMTTAQANAAYAKLTDPRAQAEFRREHAEELGLSKR
jgi:hypothetical protein